MSYFLKEMNMIGTGIYLILRVIVVAALRISWPVSTAGLLLSIIPTVCAGGVTGEVAFTIFQVSCIVFILNLASWTGKNFKPR